MRTNNGLDVAEFPDSNKLIIGPTVETFDKDTQVDYFKNEEKITDIWNDLKHNNK